MNTLQDRIAEAVENSRELIDKLTAAAPPEATQLEVAEALVFVGINCDVDEDDYETIETVFLMRLSDTLKTGER